MSAGFGVDTWCADSLQPGRLVSGWRLVAQALVRRITTPRGSLSAVEIDDVRGALPSDEEDAYGLDVPGYVGAVGAESAALALPGLIRGEWSKDDRVLDVDISAAAETDSAGFTTITLDGSVTLQDEAGTFDFTLAASSEDLSVLLLGGP